MWSLTQPWIFLKSLVEKSLGTRILTWFPSMGTQTIHWFKKKHRVFLQWRDSAVTALTWWTALASLINGRNWHSLPPDVVPEEVLIITWVITLVGGVVGDSICTKKLMSSWQNTELRNRASTEWKWKSIPTLLRGWNLVRDILLLSLKTP